MGDSQQQSRPQPANKAQQPPDQAKQRQQHASREVAKTDPSARVQAQFTHAGGSHEFYMDGKPAEHQVCDSGVCIDAKVTETTCRISARPDDTAAINEHYSGATRVAAEKHGSQALSSGRNVSAEAGKGYSKASASGGDSAMVVGNSAAGSAMCQVSGPNAWSEVTITAEEPSRMSRFWAHLTGKKSSETHLNDQWNALPAGPVRPAIEGGGQWNSGSVKKNGAAWYSNEQWNSGSGKKNGYEGPAWKSNEQWNSGSGKKDGYDGPTWQSNDQLNSGSGTKNGYEGSTWQSNKQWHGPSPKTTGFDAPPSQSSGQRKTGGPGKTNGPSQSNVKRPENTPR